jgi:hypothetical protein
MNFDLIEHDINEVVTEVIGDYVVSDYINNNRSSAYLTGGYNDGLSSYLMGVVYKGRKGLSTAAARERGVGKIFLKQWQALA